MWNRAELKSRAKAAVKANYWQSVIAGVVVMIAAGTNIISGVRKVYSGDGGIGSGNLDLTLPVVALFVGIFSIAVLSSRLIKIFLLNPLYVGGMRFFDQSAKGSGDLQDILFPFRSSYLNVVVVEFLRGLFTMLWTLLLIIPGIVKGYEYMMIPYILSERPDTDYREAFAESKRMMTGQKMNAFVLDLSFVGWLILSALTCGILGVFYVMPYMNMTKAELYETLKGTDRVEAEW